MDLNAEEKQKVSDWLTEAYNAALEFDGSEHAEERLFVPLNMFDQFVRAKSGVLKNHESQREIERDFVRAAMPDAPDDMPHSVYGVLDIIAGYYERLAQVSQTSDSSQFWDTLQEGGANIQDSPFIFVQTDDGRIKATGDTSKPYEVITEPRLASLIQHLAEDGVNGQKIYMDDIRITKGQVDDHMMREHPYNIVQIPRLDMEIAVCDQIGETTFVKQGTVGSGFWDIMTKDGLKARDDVVHIDKRNESQWWEKIQDFLAGKAKPSKSKIKVSSWKPKLDYEMVKLAIETDWRATGRPVLTGTKGEDGKKGSYKLSIAGEEVKVGTLANRLSLGGRGLPKGSSIAQINEELSAEHEDLFYENRLKKTRLKIEEVKAAILADWRGHGRPATSSFRGEDGIAGSYELSIAGEKIKMSALNALLAKGNRDLPKGSSISQILIDLSAEYDDLHYENPNDKPNLKIEEVKAAILADWRKNERPVGAHTKGEDGKIGSYKLSIAGEEIKANTLDTALRLGYRYLPKGLSIAQINEELAAEHDDLQYMNHLNLPSLEIEEIKAAILTDWRKHGRPVTRDTIGGDGNNGSYTLNVAGEEISMSALDSNLLVKGRGLSVKSSISQIKKELLLEHPDLLELDQHEKEKPVLSIEDIGVALLKYAANHKGEMANLNTKDPVPDMDDKWKTLNAAGRGGHRNMPEGMTLPAIKRYYGWFDEKSRLQKAKIAQDVQRYEKTGELPEPVISIDEAINVKPIQQEYSILEM